jgi:hypothetical protein
MRNSCDDARILDRPPWTRHSLLSTLPRWAPSSPTWSSLILLPAPRRSIRRGPMTMTSKIAERHLSRQAYVYIRQSTMGQVRFNQESTERQYNLMTKAGGLGWKPDQIRILDRDLLRSRPHRSWSGRRFRIARRACASRARCHRRAKTHWRLADSSTRRPKAPRCSHAASPGKAKTHRAPRPSARCDLLR